MLGLIPIQTVVQSDGIFLKHFNEKDDVLKKYIQVTKDHSQLPSMQRVDATFPPSCDLLPKASLTIQKHDS